LAQIEGGNHGLNVMANMDTAWRFAAAVVKAKMAPRSLDSTEKVFIALQMGAEVGLSPMQSLKNIAVINGSPAMWGDAVVALVRRSPVCKSITHKFEGQGESRVCIVTGVRDNGDISEGRFGYADAKRAGLLSKDTYKAYPDRMFLHRAFGYVAHDLFADLLSGLDIAEEVQDVSYSEGEQKIESGDDAPLNSLDDAAELLGHDDDKIAEAQFEMHATGPTEEELSDPEYLKSQADIAF
jgi:hypothetical protein